MKNNHTQLKRLAAISLCLVMCLSALPMLAPSASAKPVAKSNELIGDYVVFEQDYSTMSQLPDNVFLMNRNAPYVPADPDALSYNSEARAVQLHSTPGTVESDGYLYIVGFSPNLRSTRTFDIEISAQQDSSVTLIDNYETKVQFRLMGSAPNRYLEVAALLTPSTERVRLSGEEWPKFGDVARFELSIDCDALAGTYDIYVNGMLALTANTSEAVQYWLNEFNGQCVRIWNVVPEEGANHTMRLYSVKETVPQYEYVSPIPNPKITSFGLDGPSPWDKIMNGVAALDAVGGVGTIWADVKFIPWYYSDAGNLTYLQQMLADGWELGIHFSRGLTDLSMEDAIDLMHSEYQAITEVFGRPPTSWSSLGNKDNITHAQYAWTHLGMVWRSGWDGLLYSGGSAMYSVRAYPWDRISRAGLPSPTYAHQITSDPDAETNLDDFTRWINNYKAAGVRIVGFYEWWTIMQNTGHTEISDLMVDDGKALSFALDNIGGKSRLYVAAPFAEIVVDGNGNEIPFEVVDDGIIIEVEAGEYQVMTKSAYQVDRAMSPLYAAIPVVVVLAVLGGLFTMVGTAFGRLKF